MSKPLVAAGIKVDRVYVSAFALTGLFAAMGGLMFMGKLTSVSQASGGSDVNLTAIAAAVIGGTSLFGGRGSAYSSLLGVIVLVAITSGLNRIGVDSSVRYIVTGAVLLLAVSIDSLARRTRAPGAGAEPVRDAHGRPRHGGLATTDVQVSGRVGAGRPT